MSFLDDLRAQRQKFLDGIDANEGDINLDIFEDFYPDQAHFLFELLQNAEDARATEVLFELRPDACIFEHNGKRQFEERDVRAITGIHNSTKTGSADEIGKFGVGFKSVFVYSLTPIIYSAQFSFKITRLVRPEKIASLPNIGLRTRFEFPFNNPKKSPEVAFDEIKKGLEQLAETTLLFLSHLESIHWKVRALSGEILRVPHSENHIEVLKQTEGKTTSASHFLRFTKPVLGMEKQSVAIAFALDHLPNVTSFDPKLPLAQQLRIVPANPGRVAVFFPADKEDSRLRFHLHAPFVPELSRASVKDTSANDPLFQQLAALAASTLHRIRELDLLYADFLGVLPNTHPEERIPPRYQPIRAAFIEEMNNEPLTPTQAKSHAPAKHLLQAKASLKDLLSAADIEFLVEYQDELPQWAINAAQKNSNADRLLSALAIRKWDIDEFVERLAELATAESWQEPDEQFMQWIAAKPVEWHQQLYALLYRELNPSDGCDRLESVRIVQLSDATYGIGKKCYFASETVKHDDILPRVAEAVYSSGRSKMQQEEAKKFLSAIGVREVGETEQIQAILEQRYTVDTPVPNDQTHFKDLRRFIALIEKEPKSAKIFAPYYIFARDGQIWGRPASVFLDTPFLETGLRDYYDALGDEAEREALAPRYEESGIPVEKLRKFAEAVGAQRHLEVDEVSCYKNPQWSYLCMVPGTRNTSPINEDYIIPEIKRLLARPTIALSRLVWKTMCSLPRYPNCLEARYQKTARDGYRSADSQLVHVLRECAWVPQNDGAFVRPFEADKNQLPVGFAFDAGYEWLKKVQFGEGTLQRAEEKRKRATIAKELGFADAATLERAQKFATLPQHEQERLLAERERPQHERESPPSERPAQRVPSSLRASSQELSPLEKLARAFLEPGTITLPEASTPGTLRNPERYKRELENQLRERKASERPREQRQGVKLRRVWEDANPGVREFLAQTYNGQCQITGKTFAKRDGKPYFEVWYLISTQEAEWLDEPGNALCVCPEYWAKLEYGARDADPVAVIDQILRWKPAAAGGREEPVLKVKLCGENVAIRYQEQHMLRLQVLVKGLEASSGVAIGQTGSTLVSRSAGAPRVIQVQEPVTVAEVAALLGLRPFQLIGELMKSDVFKGIHDELPRKHIEKLASKWGFAACFVGTSTSR